MRARLPDADGFVERDGVRVFYEVFGDGDPTILLMPAWSITHSRIWKMQVPFLARHYRVITFDGRGNGRSDRPPGADSYLSAEYAADALAVMDATGTDRAAVVSLSRGASYALHLGAASPQRVVGQVFICPTTPLAPFSPQRLPYAKRFEEALDSEDGWALRELADVLRAPVVMSENGRGAISARHPLAFDSLAFRRLREDADLVLAVGTRFVTAFGGQVPVGSARLILVNADAADLGPPRAPDLAVHGDARLALQALAADVRGVSCEWRVGELASVRSWCEEQYADISPQRAYLAAIREALPDDGVLVSELTQIGYAANACFPVYAPRTYLTPGYQGTLGYGFATALGVKAGNPGRAVVSVTGDGGFSWTLPELSTARKYRLATVTVVFNDGYFGNVRRIQRDRFGARYLASDLVNPDYVKLAGAFGVAGVRAEGPAELAAVLKQAIAAGEPVLVDAPVGEFPAPWHLIREGVPRPSADPPSAG